jgi:hypothetical protein
LNFLTILANQAASQRLKSRHDYITTSVTSKSNQVRISREARGKYKYKILAARQNKLLSVMMVMAQLVVPAHSKLAIRPLWGNKNKIKIFTNYQV